jgi:hypothetical protein
LLYLLHATNRNGEVKLVDRIPFVPSSYCHCPELIVAGKLEAGLVLTIFAVASGAFVEQVMIIVHLPRIVKATVDPVEAAAAAAVVAVEVARVLPMLELHTISTTLSKMDGT